MVPVPEAAKGGCQKLSTLGGHPLSGSGWPGPEERRRWVTLLALGASWVQEAEAIGRRGMLTAAMGGLGYYMPL